MPKVLIKFAGKDFLEVSNKKIIVLPSAYLAPISYYLFFTVCKEVIIDIHENFAKRSIRNRAYLLGSNKHILLTVPKKRTKCRTMKGIEIARGNAWAIKHWKTIKCCYNSSPYFKYYKDDFEKIYSKNYSYIFELNKQLNDLLLDILNIKCKCTYSKKYVSTKCKKYDYRNYIYSKKFNYSKVFKENINKIELSVIDLIFNLGPDSKNYLKSIYI